MDDLLTLSLVASSTPKERLFWSIVWLPELFSGIEVIESVLKKHKRVIVVGNGPIHANLGRDIDAASHRACIVRCNDFRSSTTPQTHGTSCDLQVINCTTEQHNWDILQWLAPQAHVLVAEREAKERAVSEAEARRDLARLEAQAATHMLVRRARLRLLPRFASLARG